MLLTIQNEDWNRHLIHVYTMTVFICIYPTPLQWAGYDTKSILKWSKASSSAIVSILHLCRPHKFSFFFFQTGCLTKVKEPSLFYLPIARRTFGFMTFPRALVQSEMQTALSMIWTQVTNFISYSNNCYTKHTSNDNVFVN